MKSRSKIIGVGERNLTIEDVVQLARGEARIELPTDSAWRRRIEAGFAVIERRVEQGTVVYGVNTGYGDLASVRIPPSDLRALQRNLVRSHAAG
ncbi:MAG: aromatic amino acid lyase, partial [Planctomycetota bacterium]